MVKRLHQESPLEAPSRLNSRLLRRIFVTHCNLLGLQTQEIEWLSHHMGHTKTVHIEQYRKYLNETEIQFNEKLIRAFRRNLIVGNTGVGADSLPTVSELREMDQKSDDEIESSSEESDQEFDEDSNVDDDDDDVIHNDNEDENDEGKVNETSSPSETISNTSLLDTENKSPALTSSAPSVESPSPFRLQRRKFSPLSTPSATKSAEQVTPKRKNFRSKCSSVKKLIFETPKKEKKCINSFILPPP